MLANERVVKAFRREDFERDRFAAANERYFGAYMKVTQFNQTQAPVLAFIIMLALCAIIALTAREVAVGRLRPATAWEFWTATGLLINPMNRFSIFFADFARAFVGAGRVFEILDLPVERDDPPGALRLPARAGRHPLRERHLRLRRRAGAARLLGRDAARRDRRAGRAVGRRQEHDRQPRAALLRAAGRADHASTGSTSRYLRLGDLRDAIAIVPQETQLFNGTIADNIRYGRLDAGDGEIVAAAKEANADEFVQKLPEKYETTVGERGIRLSGGQRQRIAIARAILRDPRILILDEATSALDSHSEALIEDALDRLLPGRTTLIIAHRLSTIRRATKILYIEGGRVRETGTHETLIAAGGAYAGLHAAQFAR